MKVTETSKKRMYYFAAVHGSLNVSTDKTIPKSHTKDSIFYNEKRNEQKLSRKEFQYQEMKSELI